MVTKKLYLENTQLFEAKACVLSQNIDSRGHYVVLDQTIFYVQGGGQPADQGIIDSEIFSLEITDVRYYENEIRHYYHNKLASSGSSINAKVQLSVDKPTRLLNARYHTAAHLLSNIVESLYPECKAIKGHSFPKESYVEFQGLGAVDQEKIEKSVSQVINQKLLISYFERDQIRFVQIGAYEAIPCGGMHVNNTEQIVNITINKIKNKNQITRMSYALE